MCKLMYFLDYVNWPLSKYKKKYSIPLKDNLFYSICMLVLELWCLASFQLSWNSWCRSSSSSPCSPPLAAISSATSMATEQIVSDFKSIIAHGGKQRPDNFDETSQAKAKLGNIWMKNCYQEHYQQLPFKYFAKIILYYQDTCIVKSIKRW